jgi:hypothetical protein
MKKETNNPEHKKHNSALAAASLGRSATAQVTAHSGEGALAMTGTNVSYEGATAPGAGGSVGTGYASGKQAVDATISANSDFAQNRGGSPSKTKAAAKSKEAKDDDLEDEEVDEDLDLDEDDEEFEDEDEEDEA